jgi:hypothetical protein
VQAWHDRLPARGIDLNLPLVSSVAEAAGHALSSVGGVLSGPSAFVGTAVQYVHRQEHSSAEPAIETATGKDRSTGLKKFFLGGTRGEQKPQKEALNTEVRLAVDILT